MAHNSFTQGKVSSHWKQANVTPVYKKGDRQIIINGSPISLLILVTHKIYTLDNGQDVSIAILDISKAFDRVWHRGLVNKLKTIGIRGQLLKWLTDYLENRCQRVVINGVQSPWLTIKAGVPQGSILGPLLFLVYVNDIYRLLNEYSVLEPSSLVGIDIEVAKRPMVMSPDSAWIYS